MITYLNNSRRVKYLQVILLLILFFAVISCSEEKQYNIKVSGLKCNYTENPLGIDNNPKLSWLLFSSNRNQKQSAYRIIVASTPDKLNKNTGDIWDSRKIKSDQSIQIPYRGKTPESFKRYYWKVRVWDKKGNKSEWSEPAFWETGLQNPGDWQAKWITFESESAPLLRKEFEINQTLSDARIFISGLGYYELRINGSKIGDHVLDPGQTDYEQRTFYEVYDITKEIRQGNNVIGVILGNGWYHQTAVNHGKFGWKDVDYGIPRLICQTHLTFSDGSKKIIISDETWKASNGPIIYNNIYAGEHYDAQLEKNGWDTSSYDDLTWEPVQLIDGPGGKLVYQNIPPVKRIKTITPVNITNPKPGVYIYDMGQNFAGWARLKVKAEKGTTIRMRFAEWLGKDGMIDPGSTGYYATGVVQTDKYICSGKGIEIWEPKFTYHGFQYVELTGYPGTPDIENLEGVVVHTSLERSGHFECSDLMINKLYNTALWTLTSNLHSIPTDCPHRERCGWLGDAFLISDMTIYNYEAALFWSKFIRDIETSRRGDIPNNIAPGRRTGGKDPDWGAAFIQLPYNLFLYYNDTSIITEHYEGMTFFMDHLQKLADNYIIRKGIGSLFPPGRIMPKKTPPEFTSTGLFYFCASVMSEMAKATGKNEDATHFNLLAKKIKKAFNDRFYDHRGKTYGGQEKNVLALAWGLVPEQNVKAVAKDLNRYVTEVHNGHVSTGIFGTRYIYGILSKYGYEETVQQLFNTKSFPGYGYLFDRGATTFWENWGELKFEDRDAPGDDRSKCHPFQGGFTAWMFCGSGGIKPDPENPGFKHIILSPNFLKSQSWSLATYNSIHGKISSKWQNTFDELIWAVSIPVNTTATLYIPTDNKDAVTERNIKAEESDGVTFMCIENGHSLFKVGSGDYVFKIAKNIR